MRYILVRLPYKRWRAGCPSASASGMNGQRAGLSARVIMAVNRSLSHWCARCGATSRICTKAASASARAVRLTLYVISGLHLGKDLLGGLQFATLRARDALTDSGQRLHVVQPVEQVLIAGGILYHDFCPAIDGQHFRRPCRLEPRHMGFVVSEKIGQRVNLSGIEHGLSSMRELFDYCMMTRFALLSRRFLHIPSDLVVQSLLLHDSLEMVWHYPPSWVISDIDHLI